MELGDKLKVIKSPGYTNFNPEIGEILTVTRFLDDEDVVATSDTTGKDYDIGIEMIGVYFEKTSKKIAQLNVGDKVIIVLDYDSPYQENIGEIVSEVPAGTPQDFAPPHKSYFVKLPGVEEPLAFAEDELEKIAKVALDGEDPHPPYLFLPEDIALITGEATSTTKIAFNLGDRVIIHSTPEEIEELGFTPEPIHGKITQSWRQRDLKTQELLQYHTIRGDDGKDYVFDERYLEKESQLKTSQEPPYNQGDRVQILNKDGTVFNTGTIIVEAEDPYDPGSGFLYYSVELDTGGHLVVAADNLRPFITEGSLSVDQELTQHLADKVIIFCQEKFGRFIDMATRAEKERQEYLAPKIEFVIDEIVTDYKDLKPNVKKLVFAELFADETDEYEYEKEKTVKVQELAVISGVRLLGWEGNILYVDATPDQIDEFQSAISELGYDLDVVLGPAL